MKFHWKNARRLKYMKIPETIQISRFKKNDVYTVSVERTGEKERFWRVTKVTKYVFLTRFAFRLVGLRVEDCHLYSASKVGLFQALVASELLIYCIPVLRPSHLSYFELGGRILHETRLEKRLELTNRLRKARGESLLCRMCKLQDGWKSLRRAMEGWTMIPVLNDHDETYTKSFYPKSS